MEASLLDLDFEAELRAFQARRAAGRSRGRHCSDLVHYVMGHLDPKRFGERGAIDPTLAHGGFIWEDVMSTALGRQFGRPRGQIEIEVSGGNGPPVFLTLDDFTARRWRVIEYKMTKISAANPIRSAKFLHWHMQLMAYCLHMETCEAELFPFFVNGSYELGGGRFGAPVVGKGGRGYLMQYTVREMRENWETLLRANEEMPFAA